MELKSSSHVVELKNITVDEEMSILGFKPNTQNIQKIFGNNMILSREKLCKPLDMDLIDIKYDASNFVSTYVTMMLVTCPPFYNFIANFYKTADNFYDFKIIRNIYQIIYLIKERAKNDEPLDIEPYICYHNSSDITEGYVMLLRYIHNELTQCFFFREDSWSVPQKEKDIKQIYQEYSPISDTFQGKITSDIGNMKKGCFEYLRIGTERNLEEIIFNKYLIKPPKALLLEYSKLKTYKEIRGHKISSFVTMDENELVLYLNSNEKWFKYAHNEFLEVNQVEDIKNIKYMLIYKT